MAITKETLSADINDTLGLSKRDAKSIIETFFGQIGEILSSGENVKLSGFGNFDLRDKSARPGRNPKTGEPKEISARRVVTFSPGQKLRTLVSKA